jgi:hypothetical protein
MYKIKEALVYKNPHQLLFADYGMVIEGPKGGLYLVDGFCTEQWLNRKININLRRADDFVRLHSYMMHAINNKKIGMCMVEINGLNDFVTPKQYRGKPEFRRGDGIQKLTSTGMIDKILPIV